jgi:hypothetical protein
MFWNINVDQIKRIFYDVFIKKFQKMSFKLNSLIWNWFVHSISAYVNIPNISINQSLKCNNTKYISKSSLNQETETNKFLRLILKIFTHQSFIFIFKNR